MKHKVNIRPFTRQFYRGNWGFLAMSLVYTVFLTAGNMLTSWLIQVIVDLVSGEAVGFDLLQVSLLACLGLLLVLIACAAAYYSKPRFKAKAMAQYKEYVFSELSQKSISAFSGENTALYMSALSNDAVAIENGYLEGVFTIVDQCAMCIAALVMMFWYSPLLTLISIALALLPLSASLLSGGWMAKAETQVSGRNERYMSTLRDSLSGFSVVKSFRAELQMCRIFAREVRAVADAKELREKMAILVQSFGAAASIILQFGVFLIGAWLAISGKALTAGTVLIFVQLLNYVLNPLSTVPQAVAQFRASKALIAKLAEALSANVRQEGNENKAELQDGIFVEKLSFAYEENKPVLQDISFRFEAGKSYCIVGASGSGKSTLLNLLMASSPGYTGSIRYDTIPLREIRSESLYDMVSMVQQNVFIFNASIQDNITMFAEFPPEAVDRAVALSGLSALVRERGEGYLCGENGSQLSGGEKQRISIARSLLKNAKVMLVDEATAALDAATAAQVAGAILDLEGMTRIVVTHALDASLLRRYDCILTMKNGCLEEAGSFDELMAKKAYFYSLYTVSQ